MQFMSENTALLAITGEKLSSAIIAINRRSVDSSFSFVIKLANIGFSSGNTSHADVNKVKKFENKYNHLRGDHGASVAYE
jgi:hypothetical protein